MNRSALWSPQNDLDLSWNGLASALDAGVTRAARDCKYDITRGGLPAVASFSVPAALNAVSAVCAGLLERLLSCSVINGASGLGPLGARVGFETAMPWLTGVRLLTTLARSGAAAHREPHASAALAQLELARSQSMLDPPGRAFSVATDLCCAMCALAHDERNAHGRAYLLEALKSIEAAFDPANDGAGSRSALRWLLRGEMARLHARD